MSGGLITTGLDRRINVVNPAGERLLERRETELTGQSVDQVFAERLPRLYATPGEAEERAKCMRALLREGKRPSA